MTSPANPRSTDPSRETPMLLLTLSLLLGIQAITTDLTLPALPAITQALGAPVGQTQLTLTALLLAFGATQLVLGPLSDRVGRRPVLLGGLALYTAAAVGCALAPSMSALVVFRALQGAAMGASVMAGRAIVRDLFGPHDGARVMSRAMTGLGVIACASGPLGGLLVDQAGWRVTLATLAVFGAVTFAIVALRFEESAPLGRPDPASGASAPPGWSTILREPAFRAYGLLTIASFGALFTFLASSSFVFIGLLGMTPVQYGLVMFSMSFAYIVGTFLCRWTLARMAVARALRLAGLVSLAGGATMLLLSALGPPSTATLLVPFYLVMIGHGFHMPCGQTGAIAPFARAAGRASALNGFLMMVTAFAIGAWLGPRLDGPTALPLVHGVAFWSVVIALVTQVLIPRLASVPAAAR